MKILLLAILLLVVLIIAVYAYYGGFYKLHITISEEGGETLAYENIKGDYRQSGAVMDKIYYSLLNEDKIETYKGFGIYYDNPQKVDKDKLRSEAGSIIEGKDLEKFSLLNDKYLVKTFPVKKYITTEFPYKGKGSVFVSIMKVYSALNEYAKENGYNEDGAVMEIYDIPNNKILYRKEIN